MLQLQEVNAKPRSVENCKNTLLFLRLCTTSIPSKVEQGFGAIAANEMNEYLLQCECHLSHQFMKGIIYSPLLNLH